MKTLTVGKHKHAILLSPTVGLGVGAGAKICLELEPELEISKMGGCGNPAKYEITFFLLGSGFSGSDANFG